MNGCHDNDDDDEDDDDIDDGGDDKDDYNDEIVLSSSALKNAIDFALQGGSNVSVCGRNPCV